MLTLKGKSFTLVQRALGRRFRRLSIRVRVGPLWLERYDPKGCLQLEAHPVERARFAAIDVHNHLGRWLSYRDHCMAPDVDGLLEAMATVNVSAMVNLDGMWGDELEHNLDRYDRAHPGRFLTFCQLDWTRLTEKSFDKHFADSLRRSVAAGAGGLKVWKDLGLHVRDAGGRLVLPDDPRLSDLWDTAGQLGIPVLIHIADPVAFFRPVDRHNERLEELLRHPEWSYHSRRLPTHNRLMDAFEALVASHPGTLFIGAHLGWAENLAWVSRLLATYPNLSVDIAGRVAELGRQPRAAAALLQRHPDRVLFGSDVFPYRVEEVQVAFRLLETADEHFSYSTSGPPGSQGRWKVSGLNLPPNVLRAVYRDNAARLLPVLDGEDSLDQRL
jgi:predicted TIM-barrel fold metal-dependent hydrolase